MSLDFEAALGDAIHSYNERHTKNLMEARARSDALLAGQARFRERIFGLIAESVQRASKALSGKGGILENVPATKLDPSLTYIARIWLHHGSRELSFSHVHDMSGHYVEVLAPGMDSYSVGQEAVLNQNYPLYEFKEEEIDRCILTFCKQALGQM